MPTRPTCPACLFKPVALNYRKNGVPHYRSRCDHCTRNNTRPRQRVDSWIKSGYKIRERCENCGFRRRVAQQMSVWYVDGDNSNANWANLRTVCSNCKIEIEQKGWPAPNGLRPDF